MTPPVTTVTARPVSSDELSLADYSDIYDELRRRMSLRQFVDQIRSQYSIAWWSKYERSETPLTHQAKQELRAAVGLPQLPPTVAEATSTIDPDAAVYQVGTRRASRVVMVGSDVAEPITLHLNGCVEIQETTIAEDAAFCPGDPPGSPVTGVTRPQRQRTPSRAIRVSPGSFERLQRLRTEANMTWDEFAVWVAELCGA